MLVKFDHETKRAQLCLRGQDLLPILQIPERENPEYLEYPDLLFMY